MRVDIDREEQGPHQQQKIAAVAVLESLRPPDDMSLSESLKLKYPSSSLSFASSPVVLSREPPDDLTVEQLRELPMPERSVLLKFAIYGDVLKQVEAGCLSFTHPTRSLRLPLHIYFVWDLLDRNKTEQARSKHVKSALAQLRVQSSACHELAQQVDNVMSSLPWQASLNLTSSSATFNDLPLSHLSRILGNKWFSDDNLDVGSVYIEAMIANPGSLAIMSAYTLTHFMSSDASKAHRQAWFIKLSHALQSAQTVFVPFLINGNHWVLMRIIKDDKNNFRLSYGNSMPNVKIKDHYKNKLLAMLELAAPGAKFATSAAELVPIGIQSDTDSCGWAVWNAMAYAAGIETLWDGKHVAARRCALWITLVSTFVVSVFRLYAIHFVTAVSSLPATSSSSIVSPSIQHLLYPKNSYLLRKLNLFLILSQSSRPFLCPIYLMLVSLRSRSSFGHSIHLHHALPRLSNMRKTMMQRAKRKIYRLLLHIQIRSAQRTICHLAKKAIGISWTMINQR